MGCRSTVHLVGGSEELADQALSRIAELERRWSRFDPNSEISQLNRSGGLPTVVSPDTMAVVAAACAAWKHTAGRFDPTVHDAMVEMGYDRPWDEHPRRRPWQSEPAPGCDGIQLVYEACLVVLPPNVRLDLGGIGKGFAADLVATEIVAAGASGACISIGGDLRCVGDGPADDGAWEVTIAAPSGPNGARAKSTLASMGTTRLHHGGAAATTAPTGTMFPDGTHHLIDPATGRPAPSPWAQVTVLAATAATAEVWAKCAYLAGAEAPQLLAGAGLAAVLVGVDGRVRTVAAAQHRMELTPCT